MKKTNDFGRDSIPLLVLKISIPFMFRPVWNVLYSIVDRILRGKHSGDRRGLPLPASASALRSVTLLSSFGTLFGIGGSVLFSVRLGAEDKKNARKILANSFSYLIIVSLALRLRPRKIVVDYIFWNKSNHFSVAYKCSHPSHMNIGYYYTKIIQCGVRYYLHSISYYCSCFYKPNRDIISYFGKIPLEQ